MPRDLRLTLFAGTMAIVAGCGGSPDSIEAGKSSAVAQQARQLLEESVERTMDFYPSQALAAGDIRALERLESFAPAEVESWLAWNDEFLERSAALLSDLAAADPQADGEDFLAASDLRLARAAAERQLFEYRRQRVLETAPLFWTGKLANAVVFLLVRDEPGLDQRLHGILRRTEQIPRLARQAAETLAQSPPQDLSPDLLLLAAAQARSVAGFYRNDLPAFLDQPEVAEALSTAALSASMGQAASAAATAVEELATRFAELEEPALGSFRLDVLYPDRFRIVTGVQTPIDEVLSDAEQSLVELRQKTALFGRRVWSELVGGPMPLGDADVVRGLFERVAEDRSETIEEFIEDYRQLVVESERFVRDHELVRLPDPLTLVVDRSPAFFSSQAFGGVYSTGPWAPEADTLLLLPTPPASFDAEQRAVFFSDFNHHFNTMIIAHELVPGHYLQLKWAARGESRARAIYADPVFVEGWGTFSERLMLEAGWGDDLAYAAHLKKQLENVARTIVDIKVHTQNMSEQQVLAFVQDEALQKAQFARNMWRRAMTTSPQLTYYWLGDQVLQDLEATWLTSRTEETGLAARSSFANALMETGPLQLPDLAAVLGQRP